MRAPADLLHCRGLDDHEACARHHKTADMDEMPRLGYAVDGAVLAHRRHDDAVFDFEASDPSGAEERTHPYRSLLVTGGSD